MKSEINKVLSCTQQFRYELLQQCGNVEDAKKAYTFILGEVAEPIKSDDMKDGIYLVHSNGKATLFEYNFTKGDNMDSKIVAIGLKMGSFDIKIALHDEANGEGIPLTIKGNSDKEKDYAYAYDYDNAVSDMDGEINTIHFRNILNSQIKLLDNWCIPSLGELYRIFINKKLSMKL